MVNTTMDQITIVYRDETQQFNTVSQAAHFLRQVRIKVDCFHTVKAVVQMTVNGKVSQRRHLKGDKHLIMKELEQLDRNINLSHA